MGSSLQQAKLKSYKLLISAAVLGDASYCRTLLLNGLNVDAADNNGVTPLIRAAAQGHINVVQVLLKFKANVLVSDTTYGNTALHEAAWRGYSQTVALLTKHLGSEKSALHAQNIAGFAPLHLACQNGHNQTCRELLQAGCYPDQQNNYGDTPLHTSVRYGHAGVTRILISASCQVSVQNKNGDTALHIATAMNRRKLTRILLEAGCDKSLENKQGETARDIAERKHLNDIIEIFDRLCPKKDNKSKLKSYKQVTSNQKHTDNRKVLENNMSRNKSTNKSIKQKTNELSKDILGRDWSPYGCHYYPDLKAFPEPRLDTLPPNPLSHGEQYYLDLAGNIKKGPVGVGHTCYCAPFFKHIEVKLKKNKAIIKACIEETHDKLNSKVNHLEQKTQVQVSELTRLIASEKYKNEEKYKHLEEQILLNSSIGKQNGTVIQKHVEQCNNFRARSMEHIIDELNPSPHQEKKMFSKSLDLIQYSAANGHCK